MSQALEQAAPPRSSEAPHRESAVGYIAPFAVFIALLLLDEPLNVLGSWEYLFRIAVVSVTIFVFSRPVLSFKMSAPLLSVGFGVVVFLLWIAPDVLIPGYRNHWLFQNDLMGRLRSSIPPELRRDTWNLVFRTASAALVVPILEELFWRGWLMRWLIDKDFYRVPLGTFASFSFFITALLFATEHGPFWEVGLVAGLLYNWWMVRTKTLGDCILAHGVTNLCLSVYAISTANWQYWL